MRAITSTDVAKRAGVSRATVSYVLNDVPSAVRISEPTRERVLRAASELGYIPNRSAQSLRSQRTGMLAYVHSGVHNKYGAELMHATEIAAMERGLVFASFSVNDDEALQRAVSFLNGNGADGVITPEYDNPLFEALTRLVRPELPFVSQGDTGRATWPQVGFDIEHGGYLATQHLIERGHQRIAYIASDLEPMSSPLTHFDRRTGFLRALVEAGVEVKPDWHISRPATPEGGASGVRHLLTQASPRPTAAFIHNDWMALGALQALAGDGVTVPGDMAIVGFDGLEIGSISFPALTSIQLPYRDFGVHAVDAIARLVADPATAVEPRILEPRLLVRQST